MPADQTRNNPREPEPNLDPLTDEPGAHPVGTGIGAATAGAIGAAIGVIGGPLGIAAGAVIGAVVGGYAGKGAAEVIDPTAEDAYWRENHQRQPYADKKRAYEDYLSAYRAGYTGYRRGETFEEREADLQMQYESGPQDREADTIRVGHVPAVASTEASQSELKPDPLRWESARDAARAAYVRASRGTGKDEARPGDSKE